MKKEKKKDAKPTSNLWKGYLLYKKGRTTLQISKILGEDEKTVDEWVRFYEDFNKMK